MPCFGWEYVGFGHAIFRLSGVEWSGDVEGRMVDSLWLVVRCCVVGKRKERPDEGRWRVGVGGRHGRIEGRIEGTEGMDYYTIYTIHST